MNTLMTAILDIYILYIGLFTDKQLLLYYSVLLRLVVLFILLVYVLNIEILHVEK